MLDQSVARDSKEGVTSDSGSDVPPMSANLRSSKMRNRFRFAISRSAWAVRSVQSVTMSQCVLSRQIESPTSSASCSSSADVSTSADRQRFECFIDMRLRRYDARAPVVGRPERARYVLVRVACEDMVVVGSMFVVRSMKCSSSV